MTIGWIITKYLTTPKNLPPGPWGLPIIGYLPFLGKKPQITIANLRHKYGDVISINLGTINPIIITSFKVIKEALVKQGDIFSNRYEKLLPPITREVPGVICSNGELWSEFRRFTISALKELGFGKSSLEPQIQDEIMFFIDEIKSHNSQPMTKTNPLRVSVANVTCVLITGKRYEFDDPILNKLLHITDEHANLLKLGAPHNLLPFALHKPWILRLLGIKSVIETTIACRTRFGDIVDEYEKHYKQGSADNFINA